MDKKKLAPKAPPTPKPDLIGDYLRENLKLEIERSHFTDPNTRVLNLVLNSRIISTVSFDITPKREYEG